MGTRYNHIPCRNFAQGACVFGKNCWYSHDPINSGKPNNAVDMINPMLEDFGNLSFTQPQYPTNPAGFGYNHATSVTSSPPRIPNRACAIFAFYGECKWGNACRYLHVVEPPPPQSSDRLHDLTMGTLGHYSTWYDPGAQIYHVPKELRPLRTPMTLKSRELGLVKKEASPPAKKIIVPQSNYVRLSTKSGTFQIPRTTARSPMSVKFSDVGKKDGNGELDMSEKKLAAVDGL